MAKLSDIQLKNLLQQAYETKREGGSLSKLFEDFAQSTGRAKGSVRNVYYSSMKRTLNDQEFKKQMLGENSLDVATVISFEEGETQFLLEKILIGVTFGKSVRRVINEMTNSPKLALRYQNKYRNILRYEKERVVTMRKKIIDEYGKCYDPFKEVEGDDPIFSRLKKEINSLCDRIADGVRQENVKLKQKISELEEKNRALEEMLEEKSNIQKNGYFNKVKESI